MKKLSLKRILTEVKELPGDPDWAPRSEEELLDFYEIPKDVMNRWISSVQNSGKFSLDLYNEVKSVVKNVEDFIIDLHEAMPNVYNLFVDSGIEQAQPRTSINPNVYKNKFSEEELEAARERGREIKYPDPAKRAHAKWQEEYETAQMMGKVPPPPPKELFSTQGATSGNNLGADQKTQPRLKLGKAMNAEPSTRSMKKQG